MPAVSIRPAARLEPGDVRPDGLVDVCEAPTDRELSEETGLVARSARKGGLIAIFDGPRISLGQAYHFTEDADMLLRAYSGQPCNAGAS